MKDLKRQIDEKEPLKVLYITHYGDLYGANRSMLNMILELREKWNISPYVLLNKKGDLIEELEKNNINYKIAKYFNCAIDITKGRVRFKRWRKRIVRYLSYAFIVKSIKKYNFDIIHSNSSMVDIGYYASRKWRCPHVWHIREYGIEDYNLIQIDSSKNVRKRYISSDCVIAISQSIEKMIASIDRRINVRVVYNGIKMPKEYAKSYCVEKKTRFCIVGVISKNKNQIEVAKAVGYLVKKGYKNFCLHMVGGDFENEMSKIQSYIDANKLSDYVEFTGYISDVDGYLKKMDVGIVASYKEAFGRVTIEYMSNYMPVIGSDSGGTSELITEGENGFLYQLGNALSLAEKMEEFLRTPSILVKMGENARKYAESYSVSKNAYEVNSIYTNLC